ncbi:MAG: hypothetical protein FRX49_13018 [Trebouxia sp. A1-2]|nr:MAG: hypothetical protein FRX49_13018 [Trebouxia sp. A1-2]
MSSTSDSAIDYAAEEMEQTPGVLALLKSKELQLQVQVDKCAQLRAENVLLNKKLQALSNPTSRQNSNRLGSGELPGSIPAGPMGSAWSASDMDRLPSSPKLNSPVVLNGVLSLANAGTWLQMLRSKLSLQVSQARRPQTAGVQDTRDGAASDCMAFGQDEPEEFTYSVPMRRSRSDALYDRQLNSTVFRRAAELPRTSSVGQSTTFEDDALRVIRERDRRRRTNVLMDDAAGADQGSTVHFLTPELAARSALFGRWFWCGWREEVATVTRTVVNKLTPGFTTSSAPIVLQQEVKEEEEEEEEEESRTRRRAIREEERVRKKKEGKGGGAGREGEGETHEKGKHMKREKKNEEVE